MTFKNYQLKKEQEQLITPPNSITIHVERVPIIYYRSAFQNEPLPSPK